MLCKLLQVKLMSNCGFFAGNHIFYKDTIFIFFQKHDMNRKGKMKVSLVILIAAVNLFMHVNSTEKRRITCGKRVTFLCIFGFQIA